MPKFQKHRDNLQQSHNKRPFTFKQDSSRTSQYSHSFSQAQTNEGDSGSRAKTLFYRKRDSRTIQQQMFINKYKNNHHQNAHYFLEHSYDSSSNRNKSFNKRSCFDKNFRRESNFQIDHSKQRKNRLNDLPLISKQLQIQIKENYLDVLEQIQLINYNQTSYEVIKKKFVDLVTAHIQFSDQIYPATKNQVGKLLMKNGIFHQMWSKVIFKSPYIQKQAISSFYYNLYRQMIQKGSTNFQKAFNNPPSDDQQSIQEILENYCTQIQLPMNYHYKRTKQNCLLLFDQVRKSMEKEKEQQKAETILKSIILKKYNDYKIKPIEEQLLSDCQNQELIEIESDEEKLDGSQNSIKNLLTLRALKNQYEMQKSTESERFKLFQQCQSNQRRMKAQMACDFLCIPQYYQLVDLEIVEIKERIFSKNQQLVVLKAFTAKFYPQFGCMKIEPKLKTLIAAYNFQGLQQLIRLEKTYEKFDGLIIYAQNLDFNKYLDMIKGTTIMRGSCVQQIQALKARYEQQKGLNQTKK